jgi:intracellular septation protein
MAMLMEQLQLIGFFIGYYLGGIYTATLAMMVCSLLHLLYLLRKPEPIALKHKVIFGIIMGFGALTLAFENELFLKWKVSMIYMAMALGLLISERFFKRNMLVFFTQDFLSLPSITAKKLNVAWIIFFTSCAVINLYVAYHYSTEVWVNLKLYGFTVAMLVFMFCCVLVCREHLIPVTVPDENKEPS